MFTFPITTTFLIYVSTFPSVSSSGCISRVSQKGIMLTFTRSALSSITSCSFCSNFTSDVISYHFLFHCCTFFFVSNILSRLSRFVKYKVDLLLGDKEVTQLHALPSVQIHWINWITKTQHPVTSRLWEKGHDWSLMIKRICYLCSNLGTNNVAVKAVFLCSYLELMCCGNWNLNCVFGRLM